MISKLFYYGVLPSALNLIRSYLSNRTQIIKNNNSFSRQRTIERGVFQGSVLGPFFLNIGLNDLFYKCEDSDTANYADDATPYICGENTRIPISELQLLAFRLFQCNITKVS